ncbi:MAG TPA: VOC family protein [Solirubrobacterales bacterium]|nr:VOC family protein [Solirubrobacterales bacterium]
MSERDGFQPGVPCWVETWQNDSNAATDFYRRIFGWETNTTASTDDGGTFQVCRLRGRDVAGIGSPIPKGAPPVPTWTTFIQVEDAADTARKVTDAGGAVVVEPFASLEGGRLVIAADPAGAAFAAWEQAAHRGARVINEPGAWAMSMLVTPDPEAAVRFYGDVFGWSTSAFALGDEEITMFTLPGYLGGEPEQPVPRDVVATLAPPGAADGAPPHWSVDFWIRDPDEAARITTEMGGQVLAGPFDLPDIGMRQATLADPQGATFTITRPPGLA